MFDTVINARKDVPSPNAIGSSYNYIPSSSGLFGAFGQPPPPPGLLMMEKMAMPMSEMRYCK